MHANPERYATLFIRVPKEVKEVLDETIAGMNRVLQLGERVHTMAEVVTRCIREQLAPTGDPAWTETMRRAQASARPRKRPARPKRKALPAKKRAKLSVAAEVAP